jgi:hypothetical protein
MAPTWARRPAVQLSAQAASRAAPPQPDLQPKHTYVNHLHALLVQTPRSDCYHAAAASKLSKQHSRVATRAHSELLTCQQAKTKTTAIKTQPHAWGDGTNDRNVCDYPRDRTTTWLVRHKVPDTWRAFTSFARFWSCVPCRRQSQRISPRLPASTCCGTPPTKTLPAARATQQTASHAPGTPTCHKAATHAQPCQCQ